MERWRLGFLVPLAASIATAIFIIVIGKLLLAVHEPVVMGSGDATVRMPVVVSLVLSTAILGICALLARGGIGSRE